MDDFLIKKHYLEKVYKIFPLAVYMFIEIRERDDFRGP